MAHFEDSDQFPKMPRVRRKRRCLGEGKAEVMACSVGPGKSAGFKNYDNLERKGDWEGPRKARSLIRTGCSFTLGEQCLMGG